LAANDRRALPKAERHRLVTSLVTRKRIGTQHELMDALAAAGCRVTQATVSRDVAELGLHKVEDALGRPRYVPPQSASPEPREALASVLRQFGVRATAAQNVVVVVSELGAAPAVARALDRVRHPRVVGTLAGDDTCLVVSQTAASARELARELQRLIGG
jgi:transcriptional regulator of arginine metabolism